MNAAFNTGFVDNQSAAEQLFNRASLQEFHGKKIGKEVDQALERFEASIEGLDRAMAKNRELLEMLESNALIPEFEAALQKHMAALGVRQLPLVTLDPVQPSSLSDVLRIIDAQFAELKEMTNRAISATHDLDPAIQDGQFVAKVLQADSRFNQDKIALGFGRDKVETFVSTACHATILAVEDTWPMGFQFLTEPKEDTGPVAEPKEDTGPVEPKRNSDGPGGLTAWLVGAGAVIVLGILGFLIVRNRKK
jgi:hypothetical protein